MDYVTSNWGHPLIGVFTILILAVHEKGLRALNRRSSIEHARRRRSRMWFSFAGILLAALSISSPLEFWSMEYFWVHMLQHVSLMLAAPALYVAGAPIVPLMHAVPVRGRRRLLRVIFRSPSMRPLRRAVSFMLSPWFSIVFFSLVMVVWMLPSVFDPVMRSENLHIGLMLSTFFISGLLFWVQFIPSHPLKPRMSAMARAGCLLVTNVVMTVLAMSLSFFTSVPDYRFSTMMMRMGSMVMPAAVITLSRVSDQHIGAAILWVCGDFWCFPALILALREAFRDERHSRLVDRFLTGQRSVSADEYLHGALRTADSAAESSSDVPG